MRSQVRIVLGVTTALVLVALGCCDAIGKRLSLNEQRFVLTWTPAENMRFELAGIIVECPVTLYGSFHSRVLSKVCGLLVGSISRAIVANSACFGGHATALTESLPWNVQYRSFAGTLPAITSVQLALVGMRFRGEANSVNCLFGTTEAHPAVGSLELWSEGTVSGLRLLHEFAIPLGGEFVCFAAGEGRFEGTSLVFGVNIERASLSVTLVQ